MRHINTSSRVFCMVENKIGWNEMIALHGKLQMIYHKLVILGIMSQNNNTPIPDLVHTQTFGEHPNQTEMAPSEGAHTLSRTSCERTYRCFVDVVHVGGSSAAGPGGVLAHRKEVLSSSGQDTGLILRGFYSRSLALAGPSPGGPCLPSSCVHDCVCVCMCVIWPICHNHRAQIKMRQLLGDIL